MQEADERIEARMQELRTMAREYAKAQAERVYLERFEKSKLAILMKLAQSKGFETAASQEREARSDGAYLELLQGLKVATEQAERLRWELQIAMAGIDIWRTKESTRRAEARGYGMRP